MEKVGLIGAGVMGLTAARRIVEAERPLVVYDVVEAAVEKVRQIGAETAASPAAVGRECRVVLMFLPGPAQVEECVSGPDGILAGTAPGAVIVDLSTLDPGTTVRMAALAAERGVGYLDAPVLGRPISVGNWALPVGGRAEDLEICRPVLSLFASNIMPVGPSGAGHTIKLLNQLMFSAINAMTAEMMAVADRAGVSPELLYNTITASRAGTVSNLFVELGKHIVESDYDDPTFSVDLLCKDARLAVQMARENGTPPILGSLIVTMNELAQAQGFGQKDTSVMWRIYEGLWGRR